jgi:hypothetical protein
VFFFCCRGRRRWVSVFAASLRFFRCAVRALGVGAAPAGVALFSKKVFVRVRRRVFFVGVACRGCLAFAFFFMARGALAAACGVAVLMAACARACFGLRVFAFGFAFRRFGARLFFFDGALLAFMLPEGQKTDAALFRGQGTRRPAPLERLFEKNLIFLCVVFSFCRRCA